MAKYQHGDQVYLKSSTLKNYALHSALNVFIRRTNDLPHFYFVPAALARVMYQRLDVEILEHLGYGDYNTRLTVDGQFVTNMTLHANSLTRQHPTRWVPEWE